jgi:hypothetical protein
VARYGGAHRARAEYRDPLYPVRQCYLLSCWALPPDNEFSRPAPMVNSRLKFLPVAVFGGLIMATFLSG